MVSAYICQPQSLNSSHPLPSWYPYICSLHLCLCFCFANIYSLKVLYPHLYWNLLHRVLEKAMAPHSSTLAWKLPWTEEPGRLQSMGSLGVGHDWVTSLFTFHFHALEKEIATLFSVLAWRIPGMGEPGSLPSMGSHRVGHNWSDLAAAAAATRYTKCIFTYRTQIKPRPHVAQS